MSPDRIHRARSADGTEIAAPVLLLHGPRTPLRWFTDAISLLDQVAGLEGAMGEAGPPVGGQRGQAAAVDAGIPPP